MHISRRRFMQVSLVGLAGTLLGCTHHELPGFVLPTRRVPTPAIGDELRLVILGDWGSGQLEQWQVAQGCNAAASEAGGFHAGIFLGDNFYPGGVRSIDDPRWGEYFEEVYDTEYLGALTWHAVLGNHDHAGDPRAQIEYTNHSAGRWNMPGYFYRHDFGPPGELPLLTMIGIDTDHKLQHQAAQVEFLKREFAQLEDAAWPTIVCGHHPFCSNGRHEIKSDMRVQLEPLVRGARPLAYFCGHDHNLQLIQCPEMLEVVSGGGGKLLHNMNGHAAGTLYKESAYGFVVLAVRRDGATIEFRNRHGTLRYRHEVDGFGS